MNNKKIAPDALIRSLRSALDNSDNLSYRTTRIRKMVSMFPPEDIHILHDGKYVSFYERIEKRKAYLKKDSNRLYQLARKLYLQDLLDVLTELSKSGLDSRGFTQRFEKLAELMQDFSKGNLDLARIVFTPEQYKWFTGEYHRKKFIPDSSSLILKNSYGDRVRSKSEQVIGNKLWDYAIPCHYEEKLIVNVQPIVDSIARELKDIGWNDKNPFYYRDGACYWNVPKELLFINAPASLWHTYDSRNGCVAIYPDYTIMLADGTRLYWEHEGLLEKFVYRINAIDRVFVMRSAGNINPLNIVETEERDSTDEEALENIIRARVIPRIWF